VIAIFLEEPLVFLGDVFQEVLTISGSCITINDKEVLISHAWNVTGGDCECLMALVLVDQLLHRLGLLLSPILLSLLGSGDLNWYFLSLLYLRYSDQDETLFIGVLLV
jgi:hypothetical protein